MNQLLKKTLCLLLAMTMILSTLPMSAFAVGTKEDPEITEETLPEKMETEPTKPELLEETVPAREENEPVESVTEEPVETEPEELPAEETLTISSTEEIVDSGTCGDNLTWTLDAEGTLTISGTGEMTNFLDNSSAPWVYDIRSVVIEEGVTSIGDYAFWGRDLTSVVIPESIISIGIEAFRSCSRLTSVTIPGSVTSIGDGAFSTCRNVETLNIGSVESWLRISMGDSSSNPLHDTKVSAPSVFVNGIRLEELVIPEGLKEIPKYAFSKWRSITSATIPGSVTSIGNWAFYECSRLTNVTIMDGVTSINHAAFAGCSSLTSVTIPGSASIGDDAFSGCSSLTSVTIMDGVTSIGEYAFFRCSGLANVTIPGSVTSISGYAFQYCSGLTNVTIQEGVTRLGNSAFYGCSSLTSVMIPSSVTSIGLYAFYECSRLTSVTIPGSVTAIGGHAFSGCSRLTSVTIPGSVTSIGNNAFYECSSLTSVTIMDGVTRVNSYAFQGCTSLTSITLPSSITSLEKYAFCACSSLERVIFLGHQVSTIHNVFDGIPRELTIFYPADDSTWTDIGWQNNKNTLVWKSYLPGELPEITDEDTSGEILVRYMDSFTSKEKTVPIQYDDAFFDLPSTTFRLDLAEISLGGAMAATTFGESGIDKNGDVILVKDGDAQVRDFLKKIGCDDTKTLTKKFSTNHLYDDTVAFAISYKPLDNGTYLVPVLVRGAGYGAGGFGGEWASNFRVYDNRYPEYAAGFKKAADDVYDNLIRYYQEVLQLEGISADQIKIWTMGFSRAAAVSSLLSARLVESGMFVQENIYSYNFATPGNVKQSRVQAYSNIFNIVSEQDIVPRVALLEPSWNYRRFGITYYLPSISNSGVSYLHWKNKMAANYLDLTGIPYKVGDGQETTIDLLMQLVSENLANDEIEYSLMGIQDTIIQAIRGRKITTLLDVVYLALSSCFGEHAVLVDFANLVEHFDTWSAAEKAVQAARILGDLGGASKAGRLLSKIISGVVADSIVGGNMRYLSLVEMLSNVVLTSYSGLEKTNSNLIMQHTEEAYLAWLRVAKTNSHVLTTTGHKITSVKCPVDVEVYDEDGLLVCRIVNDEVDESIEGLYAYVENGEKYIYIPEYGTYQTIVTAREDGEVSIVTTNYDADRQRQNTVGYVNVEMEAGQVFEVNDSNIVTTEGQTLEQDLNYWGKQEVTMAVSVEGPGAIIGDGTYNVGESAMLYAVPNENSIFLGWYDEDGQRISGVEGFAYLMMEDAALTARFCEAEDVEVAISQNYLAMKSGDIAQLNIQAEPAELQSLLTWKVENADERDETEIITVDENGSVTAVNPGTAYVIAEAVVGGESLRARCRIDVVGGEEEHPIAAEVKANGADLLDSKAVVELFKTDYAKVGILLNFMQNMTVNSVDAAPADQGAAIEGARFSDDALNDLFRLRVRDDRTLEIIPTEEAVRNPASVKSSYKSTVKVTVDGMEFETAVLTLTVKKSQPNIKAGAVKINTFDSASAPITFTGGKVTALRAAGALPAGFAVEGMNVSYTGSLAKTSAKLNLMAMVEGFAVEKAVTVSVSVARTEPTVKLKPASVTLLAKTTDEAQTAVTVEDGRELELTLLDSTGKVSDALNYRYEGGTITVSPKADTPAGTYKLAVNVAGSAKKATLTVKVADKKAALNLKASGAIDTAIPYSPITITTKISGFHAGTGERYSVTVLNGTEDVTSLFVFSVSGNVLTLTAAGDIPKGTYTANIGADLNNDGEVDCENTVKLPVKWSDPAKVPVSVTLKASGKIDVVQPGTSVTVTPAIRNWFLHSISASDLVFYKNGAKLEDAPFHVSVEDGAYVITNNGADSSAKYTVAFSAELGGKTVTSKAVTLSVGMSSAKIVQSTKTVTLLKKDRYDSAIIHLDVPEGFTGIASVQQDKTSSALYTVTDLGGGDYAISFANHKAAAKGATVKLQVFLKGNLTTKANANVSVKVTLK